MARGRLTSAKSRRSLVIFQDEPYRWRVAAGASPPDVQQVLSDVLSPWLGHSMASSVVRGYVARLNGVAVITAVEAEQLIGWIAPGLKVFVGPPRTAAVLDELRRAMATLLEGR
jgi:hypothetical protein